MKFAKAAVKDFMSSQRDGGASEREEVVSAIDKEVHQDHYHTSVQPVKDREIHPEQHHHNIVPVKHRSFEREEAEKLKAKLASEQAQFHDYQQVVKGSTHRLVAHIVAGEHVHHHLYETIQPVVKKRTFLSTTLLAQLLLTFPQKLSNLTSSTPSYPSTRFTTMPPSTIAHLPCLRSRWLISKKQGGVLTGREERYDGFEVESRAIGGELSNTTGTHVTSGLTGSRGTSSGLSGSHGTTGFGTTGSPVTSPAAPTAPTIRPPEAILSAPPLPTPHPPAPPTSLPSRTSSTP
ncbi:hypothetical protein LTR95_001120 [Oleoguttula sp. CCFEE 5521]